MTPLVRRYGRNERGGRDFICGDLHGCLRQLSVALERVGFDPERDRLFALGDLVDRGPDSPGILALLDKDWFHAVLGNHDAWMRDYLEGRLRADQWMPHGGAWFIGEPVFEQYRLADCVEHLPLAIELETEHGVVGLVHAECPTQTWVEMVQALASEDERDRELVRELCLWSRRRFDFAVAHGGAYSVPDVHAVVCGHTGVRRPTWLANHLFIDTGAAFRGGRLTIVDAATLQPGVEIPEQT